MTTDNTHVVIILEALIYWYQRALKAEAKLAGAEDSHEQ